MRVDDRQHQGICRNCGLFIKAPIGPTYIEAEDGTRQLLTKGMSTTCPRCGAHVNLHLPRERIVVGWTGELRRAGLTLPELDELKRETPRAATPEGLAVRFPRAKRFIKAAREFAGRNWKWAITTAVAVAALQVQRNSPPPAPLPTAITRSTSDLSDLELDVIATEVAKVLEERRAGNRPAAQGQRTRDQEGTEESRPRDGQASDGEHEGHDGDPDEDAGEKHEAGG